MTDIYTDGEIIDMPLTVPGINDADGRKVLFKVSAVNCDGCLRKKSRGATEKARFRNVRSVVLVPDGFEPCEAELAEDAEESADGSACRCIGLLGDVASSSYGAIAFSSFICKTIAENIKDFEREQDSKDRVHGRVLNAFSSAILILVAVSLILAYVFSLMEAALVCAVAAFAICILKIITRMDFIEGSLEAKRGENRMVCGFLDDLALHLAKMRKPL